MNRLIPRDPRVTELKRARRPRTSRPTIPRSLTSRSILAATLAAAGLIAAPVIASADVLVNFPGSHVACGDDIQTGVWYQSFSGGPRWAVIQILSYRKRVIASKRVTARASGWRYYNYTPQCGRHYYVRYQTAGGTSEFRVWVSS